LVECCQKLFFERKKARLLRREGMMREWESGRVGEWESGRVGEWESGRVGEWESGRVGEWERRGGEEHCSLLVCHFTFVITLLPISSMTNIK
jgi:hypothetical protein